MRLDVREAKKTGHIGGRSGAKPEALRFRITKMREKLEARTGWVNDQSRETGTGREKKWMHISDMSWLGGPMTTRAKPWMNPTREAIGGKEKTTTTRRWANRVQRLRAFPTVGRVWPIFKIGGNDSGRWSIREVPMGKLKSGSPPR